jgi:hypothetical protein
MHGNEWMEVTAIGTAVKHVGNPEGSKGQVVLNAG